MKYILKAPQNLSDKFMPFHSSGEWSIRCFEKVDNVTIYHVRTIIESYMVCFDWIRIRELLIMDKSLDYVTWKESDNVLLNDFFDNYPSNESLCDGYDAIVLQLVNVLVEHTYKEESCIIEYEQFADISITTVDGYINSSINLKINVFSSEIDLYVHDEEASMGGYEIENKLVLQNALKNFEEMMNGNIYHWETENYRFRNKIYKYGII